MTRVIFHVGGGSAYIDINMHSGDHDVCTMISTIANVIICGTEERGNIVTKVYEPGHVRMCGEHIDTHDMHILEAARTALECIEDEHPEHIRIY